MITEERVEKAIRYMAETDEDYARAFILYNDAIKHEGVVISQSFMHAKKLFDTVAEANAAAKLSKEYTAWEKDKTDKGFDYMTLKAKRDTEKLIWETWRTEQANLRNT